MSHWRRWLLHPAFVPVCIVVGLVLRLLVDLNQKLGKTIIVITHNSALAQVADRVAFLRSGEVSDDRVNAQPIPPEEVVW